MSYPDNPLRKYTLNLTMRKKSVKLYTDNVLKTFYRAVRTNRLDKLLNSEINLPKGFQSISNLNLAHYLYKPKTMRTHEIVSQSIENTVNSLVSILSSCV